MLLYLLEKRGFITYDFQNLGPETLPTLSFDASKFTKNIRNLPAFIKNLRQNYQKSAKNLVQKFDGKDVYNCRQTRLAVEAMSDEFKKMGWIQTNDIISHNVR